jgi:hypothetical protein
MTKENLIKANELKLKLDKYYTFIDLFTPTPYVEQQYNSEGLLIPTGMMRYNVSLTANYSPGSIDVDGNVTSGKWSVVSASMGAMNNTSEILEIINEIASSELSNIGADIITAITAKIEELQTEFNNL